VGIVVGADGAPIDTHFIRNIVYDNVSAIRVEDSLGIVEIRANELRDNVTTEGTRGMGVQLDKTGMNVQILGNLIQNVGIGINQNWREAFDLTIDGNTFRGTQTAVLLESNTVAGRSTLTNNRFQSPVSIRWGNQTTSNPAQIGSGNTTIQ
jgi:hypothetical protein